MFDLFQAVLEATVEAAKREGRYDDGIVDVSGTSIVLTGPPAVVRQVRPAACLALCTSMYHGLVDSLN